MALILDKTSTGITSSSVIETGIITDFTKTGTTEILNTETGYIKIVYDSINYIKTEYITGLTGLYYEDIFGSQNENPYLIINSISIDRTNPYVRMTVLIFKDKNARINKKNPIYGNEFNISDADTFNKYFSMTNLESISIFKRAYEYISTIFTNWKSDE